MRPSSGMIIEDTSVLNRNAFELVSACGGSAVDHDPPPPSAAPREGRRASGQAGPVRLSPLRRRSEPRRPWPFPCPRPHRLPGSPGAGGI